MFHKVSSWRCISTAITVESATSPTWSRKRHAAGMGGTAVLTGWRGWVVRCQSKLLFVQESWCRMQLQLRAPKMFASCEHWKVMGVEVLQPYNSFAMPQFVVESAARTCFFSTTNIPTDFGGHSVNCCSYIDTLKLTYMCHEKWIKWKMMKDVCRACAPSATLHIHCYLLILHYNIEGFQNKKT